MTSEAVHEACSSGLRLQLGLSRPHVFEACSHVTPLHGATSLAFFDNQGHQVSLVEEFSDGPRLATSVQGEEQPTQPPALRTFLLCRFSSLVSAFAIAYVQVSISDFACARGRKQTHTHTHTESQCLSLSFSLSLACSYLKTVNQSFACCRCIFNLSIFCCGVSSHHAPKTDQRMLNPFKAPSRKPEAAPLALAPSCKVKLQEKVKLKARFRALEPPNQGP